MKLIVAIACLLVATGCDRGAETDAGAAADSAVVPAAATSDSMSIEGFATPESVLYDQAGDVYLVSNINGQPLDKDDNGFISRIAPDGSATIKWIDGAAENVALNA